MRTRSEFTRKTLSKVSFPTIFPFVKKMVIKTCFRFIATTTCVLPELLIFESIPDYNTRTIISLNSDEINSITQKLFESVTNSNFEVSNGILERIYSFDSNSILRFWNNPRSFQVLKDLNNPRSFIFYPVGSKPNF